MEGCFETNSKLGMSMLIVVDTATRKIDRSFSDFKRSYLYNETNERG